MSAEPCVVGVDLGGTKIACGLVDAEGRVARVTTVATPAQEGPGALLDAIAAVARDVAPGGIIDALGVGAAGTIDAERGVVVSSTDALRDWAGTDVRAGLARRLGLDAARVAVENDVHAHAAGEARAGAGRGAATMLLVAVGTGVGGAIVDRGIVRRGARHVAGAIGHVPVPGAEHVRCSCGVEGHLEAIAAGPAIVRAYRAHGGDAASTREVVALAATDPVARDVCDAAARALGRGIAGLVTTLDPDVVVVSGGMVHVPGYLDAAEAAMRADLTDAQDDVRLVRAMLGDAAGVVGAGLRGWDRMRAREGVACV